MKKQLFAILFALAAISCTKEIVEQETETQVPTPDITFSATTGQDEPADSKSYIGKTDETSSILYWSPYDNLGVYCYTKELGGDGCTLSLKATSKLVSRAAEKATFDGKHAWNSLTSDNYYFYAYYPELTGSPKEVTDGVVSGFTVPSFQVKHFGYYHICSTNGFGTIPSDQMYGNQTVNLDFSPRTALFTIKVNLAPESTFEQVQLSYVKVTFDGKDADGNPAKVTGDCQLNLKDGSLTYTGNGSNVVEVSMNDYYDSVPTSVVKKQAVGVRSASFDMVLLPLTGFTGTVTFDFMTSDSKVGIASVTKTISGKSFVSGKHYVSTVEIEPVGREETANCYIVNATNTPSIKLPIMHGAKGWEAIDKYNKTTGSSSKCWEDWFWHALNGQVSGELLWADPEGLSVTCGRNGDFLDVTFSGAKNGSNAVVALKDAEGAVLWSWHIWFTDYNPDTIINEASLKVAGGYVHKYQGTEWAAGGIYADKYIMDRNLGAIMTGVDSPVLPSDKGDQTHSGLYYQYGRKDPFRPDKFSTVFSTVEGPVTMDNGALNPTTFYYRPNGYNWAVNTGSYNTDPWAGNSETALPKSAFDPCPKGWRVPVAYTDKDRHAVNTWSGFKGQVSGTSGTGAAFVQRNNGFYYRGTSSGYGGTTTNTKNAAYPSTGRLSFKDGTLGVTNEVNLWSASPQPENAKQQHNARYFSANTNATGAYDGYDTVINAISRAAGMPVRCVKE